ncbi:CsbD family protein [Dactylosporangium sp. CA-233914]|uniref:CsbD family protein n=1 Tax=Dactylosporangium sp. CA-233914 TaxID=3239934 RepID=UPI003D8C36E9
MRSSAGASVVCRGGAGLDGPAGSFEDKVRHKAQEAEGAAKEKYGDITDDERLQAEGQAEQDTANLKQAGDKARGAARKIKDALS